MTFEDLATRSFTILHMPSTAITPQKLPLYIQISELLTREIGAGRWHAGERLPAESDLAKRSLHLSPHVLASELDCIDKGKNYPIYITHTKPFETELIMAEIQRFDQTSPSGNNAIHDIRWLRAGQEFEL